MTTQNDFKLDWSKLDGNAFIQILPSTGIKTLYYENSMNIKDLPDSFDPIDWPVAKERFNKLRGFFYAYSNEYPRTTKQGELYRHTVNNVPLGITFGKHGFILHIGEDSFDFETGTNWVHSDVAVVGKNFPILEEMMEFIADYHQL